MALYRHSDAPMLRYDSAIKHFTLSGALPNGHMLALNPAYSTLSYLAMTCGVPQLRTQAILSVLQYRVLLRVLEYYPFHCPNEVLHAEYHAYYSGIPISTQTITESRAALESAMRARTFAAEMRPVRDAITRARPKLWQVHLDLRTIFNTGCIIQAACEQNTMLTDIEGDELL